MEDTSIDARSAIADSPPAGTKPVEDTRATQPRELASRGLIRDVVARARRNFAREIWDWARTKHVKETSLDRLHEVLSGLSVATGPSADAESPIFLLATGWRSGSTLLQRILVTDPNVLIWGEPLGEMALLPNMVEMVGRLSTASDHRDRSLDAIPSSAVLAKSWIATLDPPAQFLRVGLRQLLDGWLSDPAHKAGWTRWGFKEVRLGAPEAILLHWLYPKAKFVLLSRNPYDCYRSLSDSGWHHIYYNRPAIRVDSAAGIARHWNRIAMGWSQLPKGFPAFRVRYEDLIAGKVNFRELESWLGVKLNEDIALSARVGGTARRHRLGLCERWIITRESSAGMHALGY